MPIIPLFSSGVVFKNLLLLSNENIKNTILPEIISGEKIGTYCVYENDKYLTSVDEISKGNIIFEGEDITEEPVDNRAKLGMFLAFQYPESIPGVTIVNMLKTALTNIEETEYTTLELRLKVAESMEQLGLSADFADRYLNEGFSGGERKRNEILQLAVLDPKLAILDETDSGLDVDGLRVVGEGVSKLKTDDKGYLVVTHYQRLLEYIKPDFVHVFVDGKIVESGGVELSDKLEKDGYESYL